MLQFKIFSDKELHDFRQYLEHEYNQIHEQTREKNHVEFSTVNNIQTAEATLHQAHTTKHRQQLRQSGIQKEASTRRKMIVQTPQALLKTTHHQKPS